MKKFNLTEAKANNPDESKSDLLNMEIGRLIDIHEYLESEEPEKTVEMDEIHEEIWRLTHIVEYLETEKTATLTIN